MTKKLMRNHIKWLERKLKETKEKDRIEYDKSLETIDDLWKKNADITKHFDELNKEKLEWECKYKGLKLSKETSQQIFTTTIMKEPFNYLEPRFQVGDFQNHMIEKAKEDLIRHITKECKFFKVNEDDNYIRLSLIVKENKD